MNVHYVSGSRADFGLIKRCLQALDASPNHSIGVVLTGQHTVSHYGHTRQDVYKSGLNVIHEIQVNLDGQSGGAMARALADELRGFTEFWERDRPDLVLVLGDRGEMLAAAMAAVHLGIFVAHIHGGERSGTLDESFRHAISKLAHIHFPATEESAERLCRMGEEPSTIRVIGAPGIVGITEEVVPDRSWISARFGLPPLGPVALVVFHPVVQEAAYLGDQIRLLVESIERQGYAQIVLRPNSDAGGREIDEYLNEAAHRAGICVETHLDRLTYCRALASCDMMIGNSSSGIIESASFDVPCVNVGTRQYGRLRNTNTVDCERLTASEIAASIREASEMTGPFVNRYGDGHTDRRFVEVLSSLELDPKLLAKWNSY